MWGLGFSKSGFRVEVFGLCRVLGLHECVYIYIYVEYRVVNRIWFRGVTPIMENQVGNGIWECLMNATYCSRLQGLLAPFEVCLTPESYLSILFDVRIITTATK